jgi:pimeloyl-ACP methyl ester carboxylesterase
MKMAKIFGMVLLGIFALVLLGLATSTLHHRQQLRKEAEEYPPPGRMVEVNGQNLHVFAEGGGDKTLVFMAGHGTSNPTLDFKPLWKRMAEEYRIAVIEKAGYGWSESSGSPRDLDSILDETRKALELAGEEGPYILVPHSMSGLEAIYWGQKYPDEVEAIIGLDPLTPNAVDLLPDPSGIELYSTYLVSRIGLSRLMPDEDYAALFPLMRSADLAEEERRQYRAVFYRSAVTRPMLGEIRHLETNAQIVAELEPPADIPMYFFISDDQDIEVSGWSDVLTDFLSAVDKGEYLHLDTGHYVHYEKADVIAEESKTFLEGIR